MATRIGVDVGGTFTDLVFYDADTGEVRVAKGSTTPGDPDQGVVNVVETAIDSEALRRSRYFLHGTTVGINALLQRNGARVGLLTTDGFRDVLEIRRGLREVMYDVLWQAQPALVPRRLRIGVRERILADGTVDQPLVAEDVEQAVDVFRAEGVEAVAVCFVNAYVNEQHELEAEELLRKFGFTGTISLAHRMSKEIREFERTSTTVVDAYVRPVVSAYLERVESSLSESGFSGDCLITRSGGGSMLFTEGQERPFETVMSGPVAGVMGAAELARAAGLARAITADVGGTSFDTCLIIDGWPIVKYEGKVGDMPLQSAWVDVRSIGSGGGSIARVDEGGRLHVGPESAGAVPGPVCYRRGGVLPTTTDAAAVLGMLAFGELADDVYLDFEAAGRALDDLGASLGLSRDEAASGVIRVASAAMANAIRSVTIEQGEDPRDAALVAFGGAGPLMATLMADELEISTIVVPQHAGNFSAWGLLGQDVARTASATFIRPLGSEALAEAAQIVDSLYEEIESRARVELGSGERQHEAALALRYVGQLYTLTVSWPGTHIDELTESFTTQYERTFGHSLDAPLEIVAVRATVRELLPQRELSNGAVSADGNGAAERTIEAYSLRAEQRVEFAVRDRSTLSARPTGGPMIVLEPTTTTYVDVGFRARVDRLGAMIIEREETAG